jgi:hypothetical protein
VDPVAATFPRQADPGKPPVAAEIPQTGVVP